MGISDLSFGCCFKLTLGNAKCTTAVSRGCQPVFVVWDDRILIGKYVYRPLFMIQRITCASWNKTEYTLDLTVNTLYLSSLS